MKHFSLKGTHDVKFLCDETCCSVCENSCVILCHVYGTRDFFLPVRKTEVFFMESLRSKLEPFRKQGSGMEGAIQFHDGKCRNLYFGGGLNLYQRLRRSFFKSARTLNSVFQTPVLCLKQ